MKLIKKIKQWHNRRFQKRVFKALGAYETEEVIIFKKNVLSNGDIAAYGTSASATVPTLDIDEIHNKDNGHPV